MSRLDDLLCEGRYVEGVMCSDCTVFASGDDYSDAAAAWDRNACAAMLREYIFLPESYPESHSDELSSRECICCGTEAIGCRREVVGILHDDLKPTSDLCGGIGRRTETDRTGTVPAHPSDSASAVR